MNLSENLNILFGVKSSLQVIIHANQLKLLQFETFTQTMEHGNEDEQAPATDRCEAI